MTTDLDLRKELYFSRDNDTICYQSLFGLFTELVDRIEKIEKRLDQQDEYQMEQNV